MFQHLKQTIANSNNAIGEKDSAYSTYDSGLYKAKITRAFSKKSANGALGVEMHFDLQVKGNTCPFITTIWVTNTKGEVTWRDKEGGEHFNVGYNQFNSICEVLTGKPLTELTTEPRTVSVWNFTERKEMPTQVDMAVELIGKELALGVLNVRSNKGKTIEGKWTLLPDERYENTIDKVFFLKDGAAFTYNEIINDAQPEFAQKWAKKWEGKTKDSYQEVSGSMGSSVTTPALDIG